MSLTPRQARRSLTPRRSVTPRSHSRPRSRSVSQQRDRQYPNGTTRHRPRDGSQSPSRSRSSNRARRTSRRPRSRSVTSSPPMRSSKIVVEKLTKNINKAHLQEIFGSYGRIQELDLPINKHFLTNRGTAYIVFDENSEAEAAIAHMHEAQLDGAVISVSIVLPRRRVSSSPSPIRRSPPNRYRQEDQAPVRDHRDYAQSMRPRGHRYQSPRRSFPRGDWGGRPSRALPSARDGVVNRPRSYSRSPQRSQSRSRRSRSPSYSSRSRDGSIPRTQRSTQRRYHSPPSRARRRRSPSYSSFSSYSERSRSRSRNRYRRRN